MHSLIYFGFIGLFIVTVISQIQEQAPESLKFLHGTTYQGTERSPTPSASCSPSAWPGPSPAGTSPGRTASGPRPDPRTTSSSACS